MTLRQHTLSTGLRLSAPVLLSAAALAVGVASTSQAAITAPTILAGPSKDIVELGGVALASDGTGGAIWRSQDDSGSHILVAQYRDGTWSPPQRVDTAVPYNSFQPRLAAAPGGRLIAIWAQIYAQTVAGVPVYRLQAALLRGGARRFEAPFTIDAKVGTSAGDVDQLAPQIVMNDGGVAYVAYRVPTALRPDPGSYPGYPGDVFAQFRVARFSGASWSKLGVVNRNTAYTVPSATATNGPQVSVDRQGNGVVAFLEPDASGYERVWARRLFGARQGFVLKAGPQTWGGKPINGNADGFSLGGGGLGSAIVAVHQLPGDRQALRGPTLFENSLPDSQTDNARDFTGAATFGAPAGDPGQPAAATAYDGAGAVAFPAGGGAFITGVGASGPAGAVQIQDGDIDGPLAFTSGTGGASTTAWPTSAGGASAVAVRQVDPSGAVSRAVLSGNSSAAVTDLRLAGSGFGDALIGFRQDEGDATRIVVAASQVAPQPFLAYPPETWVTPKDAEVTWDRAPSGVGGMTYTVIADGRVIARRLTGASYAFPPDLLDDGLHTVRVRAEDSSGQAASSADVQVKVDSTPPTATATIRPGRTVSVAVRDVLPDADDPESASGLNDYGTSIAWGDRSTTRRKAVARHHYSRRGTYTITVRGKDVAGNALSQRLRVRVR